MINKLSESEKEIIDLEINDEDHESFRRLDQYLSNKLPISRTNIKKMFLKGFITCEKNSPLDLRKMPEVNSIIRVSIPELSLPDIVAEKIDIPILFEDQHIIVVNKPAGLVVHPAPGNYSKTLVNGILHHCPDLKAIGHPRRPGIVHRLDKGTSGVMVVAKSEPAYNRLIEMFSEHKLERYYEALIVGEKIDANGTLVSKIGRSRKNRFKMATNVSSGKEAITHFKVLEYINIVTHLELKLETGRTHQIRVHLSSMLKRPILCDSMYGNPKQQLQRLPEELANIIRTYEHPLLHAKTLNFRHPVTNKKLNFSVEPPEIFKIFLDKAIEIGQNLL